MIRLFLFLIICAISCKESHPEDPIITAMKADDELIRMVAKNSEAYEVQIQLSTIERTGDSIVFYDYDYHVNDNDYFYPASTVKLPVACLALEKADSLKKITSETPYILGEDSIKHTIRDDVRQIFAVSDNMAFNRLYEFLGRDYINRKLKEKNLVPARISHRLSIPNSTDPNTQPISFWENDSIIFIQDSIKDSEIEALSLNRIKKGKGYYMDTLLVSEPMDFSLKNYLPISTLHAMMKRIIFPEHFPKEEIFHLNDSDRNFILNCMSAPPRELGYSEDDYYDSFGKFFMFGNNTERIPDNIKIYNKVGYAYGYLTDCSYIKDENTGIEYILTATIYVNKNAIFNDNTYEFDTVGIPFLSRLGEQIHNHLNQQE